MGIHILLQHSNRQHLHRLFQTHHTTTNSTINNNTINMTDDSRKGLGDKVQEKVTPQESKSTTDKVKEGVTNTADKAQRDVVPDDQKSSGQAAADQGLSHRRLPQGRQVHDGQGQGDPRHGWQQVSASTSRACSHSPRPTINPFVNKPCDTILHNGCRLSFLTYGFGT